MSIIREAIASCRLDGETQFGITITVPGVPAPGGSKRHIGNGRMVDDAKRNAPWRATVAWTAREQYQGPPLVGPLVANVVFIMPWRKGDRRKDGTVKPSASVHPTVRPDATKLWRAAEDALTGILWQDDAQIVQQTVTKRYGEEPGMTVMVSNL